MCQKEKIRWKFRNNEGTISSNVDKSDEHLFNPLLEDNDGKWVLIDLKKIEKISWKNKVKSESLKDYMILTPASKQTTLNFDK